MTVQYPRFKAAACHASSVFLDADKTAEKACDLIAEAAANGAALVVFPESFLPGFPVWAALQAPIYNHGFFRALVAEAQKLSDGAIRTIRMAARRHGVHVSLGFTEGTDASVGCIWNSNVLIGPDGAILNHHRKLVPTFYEKLVWANGDARGLRVTATEIGRVGMLICGENTNPLARYALMRRQWLGEDDSFGADARCAQTIDRACAGGWRRRHAIRTPIRTRSNCLSAAIRGSVPRDHLAEHHHVPLGIR